MHCTYCGDVYASDMDHVVPHSSVYSGSKVRRSYSRSVVVPACSECNSLLGAKYLTTVGARAAYLAGRYPVRYRKLLALPHWTAEEIAEMGRGLRPQIEADQHAKAAVKARIEHCQMVADISPSIQDVWELVDATF